MDKKSSELLESSELFLSIFPHAPLPEQAQIVAEIEQEQVLVAVNKALIDLMQAKIQASIAAVWGAEA